MQKIQLSLPVGRLVGLTIFLFLTFIFCFLSTSFSQTYQWAHGFGNSNANTQGKSITTDAQGNVYVTGDYSDSIDFDPGPGFAWLASGSTTTFFAKYDSSGNYVWAKSLNRNPGNCFAEKIVVNSTGIYLTGHFFLNVDFDPGPATAILSSIGGWSGDEDIFIAHYDLNGNYLWAKSMGGLNEDKALDMAVDNAGNSYITGYFRDTVDLDPGMGVATFISDGFQDSFFAKYDINGNYVWGYDLCDNSGTSALGRKVAFDFDSFQIYLIGEFNGTVDFDRGVGFNNISSQGGYDSYVLKIDTAGYFIWAGSIATPNSSGTAANIAIQDTNLYLCGIITDTTDFDIGLGVYNVAASGTNFATDMFFAKYNLNGNVQWVRTLGNSASSQGLGNIKIDSLSNLFLTGTMTGSLDFDAGTGTSYQSSNGGADIAFAKYDNNGNFIWAKNIGGLYNDLPLSSDADNNSQYITGYFTYAIDCDPDTGIALISPANGQNILIGKYSEISTNIITINNPNLQYLILYPNPASTFVTIGNKFENNNFEWEVLDMKGRVVIKKRSNDISLNVAQLTLGIYLLELKNNNSIFRAKFIKK